MRVATIDIGTNTVLLLVAESRPDGTLSAVAERATVTRLGEGVDRTRRLGSAAIERTRVCLDEYAVVVRKLGAERVGVVGTSAMRDAGGGDELRAHVRALFGVDARVVSGDDEARLTFHGALSGLTIDRPDEVAVFDIGGGSTEVVIGRVDSGRPVVAYAASFDVGSVRLTERHVVGDPPTRGELDAVARSARDAFVDVPPLTKAHEPVGIAGTMTTLAAVSLGLVPYDGARVHGHRMSTDELRVEVSRLAALGLESRKRVPGVEPKRADVIVAGGVIATALLDHWRVSAIHVSDRGVRWGLAEEIADCGPGQ